MWVHPRRAYLDECGGVTLVYDGFGNRGAETAGGVTTKYLVEDDVNPTGYAQVVEELVGTTVRREYSYGLQRISENQLISSTWTPSFYGYDGGGSVRQLTNSSDTVTDKYDYDAFGNLVNSTGTTPNSYRYRAEQFDSDLGLYYLRARYYNPKTGRFLSRDPKDGKPANPKTMHKYLYVGGDPVNWVDPRGRDLVEYEGRLNISLQQVVPYANAIGCGIAIGITLGEGTLINDLGTQPYTTAASLAATGYGCVTAFAEPTGVVAVLDPAINVGACALSLYLAVDEENELLGQPDEINTAKPGIDLVGGVVGCAISAFGQAFGGD